jgi:hypothetical protein
MDKKLKAKWVKALRSGKYRQTRNVLSQNGAYCCLGVLRCLLPAKVRKLPMDHENYSEVLNAPQQKCAGLVKAQQKKLAGMNDNKKLTFPQIADYVEANL